LIIRTARPSDLARINAIYNQAVTTRKATGDLQPLSLSEHEAWLEDHPEESSPVLVAEEDGRVLGYNSLSFYRGGRGAFATTRETSYYIDPAHHRLGIATALMHRVYRSCPALGVDTLITFVLANNDSSIAFLEKEGFTLWGVLPAIARLGGAPVDHHIYGLHLRDRDGESA
jgi:phosphinothricin acetyltransferase